MEVVARIGRGWLAQISSVTTYLRPMGSTVPQIYGLSADEP